MRLLKDALRAVRQTMINLIAQYECDPICQARVVICTRAGAAGPGIIMTDASCELAPSCV